MSDKNVDFDDLVQHQKELMELQNNVQRSLMMIQQKLSQNNAKPPAQKTQQDMRQCTTLTNYGAKTSCMNLRETTPVKTQGPVFSDTENEADISFDLAKNFRVDKSYSSKTPQKPSKTPMSGNKSCNDARNSSSYKTQNKSFVSSNYVDYAEVINDCNTEFKREVITPNKLENTSIGGG